MDQTIQIPGYSIEKSLGSGAMASVYLATQQALERKVALKVMAASLVADASFCGRFIKEGKIIGQLNHPNIITIYNIGVHENIYYMAMEYVEGLTVKEHIQSGLETSQALGIAAQMATALAYAHRQGVIHRDIKPANILLRHDGTAVLSDFGIAKVMDESTQITQQGFTIGTPKYMSPEQALGKEIDARTDVYSLGAVLYEMLTGKPPYQAADSFALALMHVNEPVPQLLASLAKYQSLITRTMAKEVQQRFLNAEGLLAALLEAQSGEIRADSGTELINTSATEVIAVADISPTPESVVEYGTNSDNKPKPQGHVIAWVGTILGASAFVVASVLAWNLYMAPDPVVVAECAQPAQLTVEVRQRVEQLLEIAQLNQEIGRLVDPPISNAAHGYQEILKLDPCHQAAKTGLEEIVAVYESQARDSLEQNNDLAVSLNLVEAGLLAIPNHPLLLTLKQKIEQQLVQN